MRRQRLHPTQFFRRVSGTWRFLTAGTAFPEDSLRELGVPQELWTWGEFGARAGEVVTRVGCPL